MEQNFLGKLLLAQKGAKMTQFVHFSVSMAFLSELVCYFFYILHEVEEPSALKTEKAKFLWKILAYPKPGQKGPKWHNF